MYWWSMCLGLASLFLVITTSSSSMEETAMQRVARNFPYSVSLYRMLGHDRQLSPFYGEDDEMAALIDGLNLDPQPRLRRSPDQIKRYACRFKFCRIFDA